MEPFAHGKFDFSAPKDTFERANQIAMSHKAQMIALGIAYPNATSIYGCLIHGITQNGSQLTALIQAPVYEVLLSSNCECPERAPSSSLAWQFADTV